jgi:hypothetical protein
VSVVGGNSPGRDFAKRMMMRVARIRPCSFLGVLRLCKLVCTLLKLAPQTQTRESGLVYTLQSLLYYFILHLSTLSLHLLRNFPLKSACS